MKTIALFFLLSITVYSQIKISVNPGLKFSLAFGKKVQFVLGGEFSLVFYKHESDRFNRYGIVFDFDKIDDVKRLHVGFEYMYKFVGIDVGPTFGWKESKLHYGYSIIPFGGAFFLPYVNYTHFKELNDQFDFGTYLKIPIPLSKEHFSVGG